MNTTIRNIEQKRQVLLEEFKIEESGVSFREYCALCGESDPDFYRWLTEDREISDFGDEIDNKEELIEQIAKCI